MDYGTFMMFSNQLPSSGNNHHYPLEKLFSHIMRSNFNPRNAIPKPSSVIWGGGGGSENVMQAWPIEILAIVSDSGMSI